MSLNRQPLPPFEIIERALAATSEVLAHEAERPSSSAPHWNEFEWVVAEASATLHGIAALLASRLRWRGPDRWQEFLDSQARHTELRRDRIFGLLARADAVLRDAEVPAIALKGAALYGIGAYRDAVRPMADIDLLVRPDHISRAASALAPLGYTLGFTTWRHDTLVPLVPNLAGRIGEHIDNPINIELHSAIAERLPVSPVDITGLTFTKRVHPGLNSYPSQAALMRHLLLHAAGNLRARALRYIQLHDLARLGSRLRGADWAELSGAGDIWWALAPLALVQRYAAATVPDSVMRCAAAGCPALLRRACQHKRLTDVSWAKLRIEALPGLEWCASPFDAVRFALRRAWPRRVDLEELGTASRAIDYSSAVPWYGLSHAARIVRWIFGSPPRVQAIYAVQQALGRTVTR